MTAPPPASHAPLADDQPTGHDILFPPLPHTLAPRADRALRDVRLQQYIGSATQLKDRGRTSSLRDAFADRADAVRELAGRIKQHTLDHLDTYLERFIERATAAGVRVHFAADADQANAITLDIARANACRSCVKAKSMVTEETRLVPALEAAGIETVETDLGEFIVQLDHDAPSHLVTPIIHKNRQGVARTFARELGVPYTEDPAELTRTAREHLRRKFRRADLGISGANFLLADTGSIVLCSNEGNIDLSVTVPRIHIALVGIEKLIPSVEHLAILLKLLARSATAQPLTVYTTLITGPRRPADPDGPVQVHVILLNNGRTDVLRAESRELLRCIRCGACLNACPVYRKAGGGHAYGAVYSGPIGAVLTPGLKGLRNYPDLPHASSLCGACHHACPVNIDIPAHLVRLRRESVRARLTGIGPSLGMRAWAWIAASPTRYRLAAALARTVLRQLADTRSADGRPWLTQGPGPIGAWTRARDLPTPAPSSFHQWWSRRDDHREFAE